MLFLTLIIGFITAVIAAAPPGAANLAVINTSVNKSFQKSHSLIIGAGFGEIAIAFITLFYTKPFVNFFQENSWIQISVFTIFICIGLLFLLKNYLPKNTFKYKNNFKTSSLLKGFLFAFINPPVLLFWVLAFTIINMYGLKISEMSMAITLFLFFLGIFIGKTTTLYAYAFWGNRMRKNPGDSKQKIQKIIGSILILMGIFQIIKFSYL